MLVEPIPETAEAFEEFGSVLFDVRLPGQKPGRA